MKNLLKMAASITLFVALATGAFAAGTLTSNPSDWTQLSASIWKKTIAWQDDTNGTTGTIAVQSFLRGSVLWQILTDPGATAPTDNYDVYLKISGADLLGAAGENRDTTTSEYAYPADKSPIVDGNITFQLSGNSVNNAVGTVTIYLMVP